MVENYLISEAYFLLTLDDKGQLPMMKKDEAIICLVTAGLLDFILTDNIISSIVIPTI